MGDFNRCADQRRLVGKAEVCCVGGDLWCNGDHFECCRTSSFATELDRANEHYLRSVVRSVRGAELGMTVQDWE